MRKTIPWLLFAWLSFHPFVEIGRAEPQPGPSTKVPTVDDVLKKMSLHQKVGQMFIFGFNGTNIKGQASRLIQELSPGGLVIFGRNIQSASQILKFNREAQSLSLRHSRVPLFLAVDQEGGAVTRIKVYPPLPSGLEIGSTSDDSLAEKIGRQTGHLLSLLGFNMNLAPVLDISNPRDDGFLGTRTFGSDPEYVEKLTNAYVEGLLSQNVIPTAKHFPGHGSVQEDSHKTLPKSDISREELINTHLRPYLSLAENHGSRSAVMVAHIIYSKIDAQNPATFSRPIIEGLLRQEIGYQGIVMTDDIQMGGAALVGGDVGSRAVSAIDAGVDMMMVAFGRKAQAQATRAVVLAVKKGRLSHERIDQSVRRILTAKLQHDVLKTTVPSKRELQIALNSQEMQTAAFLIFKKNFSRAIAAAGEPKLSTIPPSKVLVFSGSGTFHQGFAQTTRSLVVRHFPFSAKVDFVRLFKEDPAVLGVFHVTGKHSADVANALPDEIRRRIILVNSETPGLIRQPSEFVSVYNLLSRHPQSGAYIGQHIHGLLRRSEISESTRTPSADSGEQSPASQKE